MMERVLSATVRFSWWAYVKAEDQLYSRYGTRRFHSLREGGVVSRESRDTVCVELDPGEVHYVPKDDGVE